MPRRVIYPPGISPLLTCMPDVRALDVGCIVHEHPERGDWVRDDRCGDCPGAPRWHVLSLDRFGALDGRPWFCVVEADGSEGAADEHR